MTLHNVWPAVSLNCPHLMLELTLDTSSWLQWRRHLKGLIINNLCLSVLLISCFMCFLHWAYHIKSSNYSSEMWACACDLAPRLPCAWDFTNAIEPLAEPELGSQPISPLLEYTTGDIGNADMLLENHKVATWSCFGTRISTKKAFSTPQTENESPNAQPTSTVSVILKKCCQYNYIMYNPCTGLVINSW